MPTKIRNTAIEKRKSDHWRACADEAHAAADGMTHEVTIETMRRIAAGYEKMALAADKHEATMLALKERHRTVLDGFT